MLRTAGFVSVQASMSRQLLGRLAVLGLCAVHTMALAAPRLPGFFTDNMVLQRDRPVPVWGWADAGEEVTVSFAGQTVAGRSDRAGMWRVTLAPMPGSGEGRDLRVGDAIVLSNVVVGDVWLCSGQSNMELAVGSVTNSAEEAIAADYPLIRQVKFDHIAAAEAQADIQGRWQICSPGTVKGFTAVGTFFARKLHRELQIPIGLINSSWGGTRIEPWVPPVGFAAVPQLADFLAAQPDPHEAYRRAAGSFLAAVRKKVATDLPPPKRDTDPLMDDLDLEPLADEETPPPGSGGLPEPEDVLGKNAHRVQQWLPMAEKAMVAGEKLPALPGGWPPGWPDVPSSATGAGNPTALFNGMINPIVPYALRGAIWYQGESNGGEHMSYFHKTQALLRGWRTLWQQEFPFYFVQLANWQRATDDPAGGDGWARIREAQTHCLTIPRTGMAVIIDIGDAKDIHPRNKQDVGLRLALWALMDEYGRKDLVYSGPLYKSHTVEGGSVRVAFDHVGHGLMVGRKDGLAPTAEDATGALKRFAIAGADRTWHWAQAVIDGVTVVVSSPDVPAPVAVRYAFSMNPAGCNLYNREGLPASPFRTDGWE